MTRTHLVFRSLIHYWRTNSAVLLGVIAGTAVIGGALIVGDSVRASLRQMTLDRLGKIDYAIVGSRFVREQLAESLTAIIAKDEKLAKSVDGKVVPAIVMQAGLQAKTSGTTRRAGKVSVYGFDERAWLLIDTKSIEPPKGATVVLNESAATAIAAKVGDEVTIWIELPSAVPRDTLMGKKDNDSQEITLTVAAIAPEASGLGRLGLQPTQSLPLNAFVDLHVLQERLGLEQVKPSKRDPKGKDARVNAMFLHSRETLSISQAIHQSQSLTSSLPLAWTLSDLNLRLVPSQAFNGFVLESDQMILEEKIAETARATASEMKVVTSPAMVYLANKLWNPKVYKPEQKSGYSIYSTVAGLDIPSLEATPFDSFEFVGEKPTSWNDDDVIINEFLSADLNASVGDTINFSYHTVGSRGELPEMDRTLTVRGIVKMTGAAIDRTLTPEVKGITDVDSLANWDQPFPMDLTAVTTRDDEYWDQYRAIPKMFMPLKTAQQLWPSRYGSLTSLRIAPATKGADSDAGDAVKDLSDMFKTKLLNQVKPAEFGLVFQPVKSFGLLAATGSNDFSGLFVGFSLFLIAAAIILVGLLFRLGVEQRVRDLGLLAAVGFTSKQVRGQMLLEGTAISVVGGIVGAVAAVGYGHLMIYGLTHWWIGAIGTKNLTLSVFPLSLAVAFSISVIATLGSIWWALQHLKKLSLREQLAGNIEKEIDLASQHAISQRVRWRGTICLGIATTLVLVSLTGVIPAAAAFLGVGISLLVSAISFLSVWLQDVKFSVRGKGTSAFCRLGLRNASRQRQRTVMTVGMIAMAAFLIVTVAAFRRDPTSELPDKKSGNGGYSLVAESSGPIIYDINTPEGRKHLQLTPEENSISAKALASMNVVPIRVKLGEDASCLNLYQTKVPTILGVPQSMIDDGRFAFALGSWRELQDSKPTSPKSLTPDQKASNKRESVAAGSTDGVAAPTEAPIPVLGDLNTLMFSLHKQIGQTIAIPNDESPQHQLIVKGMFQDSVFQGVLVMSETNFMKLFPEEKGFRYFLIEVPTSQAEAASSYLETELAEYGFDAEPVADRLARFLSVQNTYLSTFQTLGGLGLLLGTFGLATVMLRNVLERQAEFALMQAIGFGKFAIATLVLFENAFILIFGLATGAVSALLATSPNLISRGANLPLGSLVILLAVVFATGMLSATFAVRAATRLPIISTLRGE